VVRLAACNPTIGMVEVVVAVAFTVLCHLVLKRRKARLDHYLLLRTAGDVTGSAGVIPYEAVKAQRDALAKYAELYPLLTARLCDLFHRVEALDQECSRINGEAPAGDHRRLLGVELTARKLAGFSTESPSIAKELKPS
jgi:hypothetical protein